MRRPLFQNALLSALFILLSFSLTTCTDYGYGILDPEGLGYIRNYGDPDGDNDDNNDDDDQPGEHSQFIGINVGLIDNSDNNFGACDHYVDFAFFNDCDCCNVDPNIVNLNWEDNAFSISYVDSCSGVCRHVDLKGKVSSSMDKLVSFTGEIIRRSYEDGLLEWERIAELSLKDVDLTIDMYGTSAGDLISIGSKIQPHVTHYYYLEREYWGGRPTDVCEVDQIDWSNTDLVLGVTLFTDGY